MRSRRDDLDRSRWGEVDAICDRFEAALKAGDRPGIEMILSDAPPDEELQERLLSELLASELEYLTSQGEEPEIGQYLLRFARHKVLVKELFRQSAETAARALSGLT